MHGWMSIIEKNRRCRVGSSSHAPGPGVSQCTYFVQDDLHIRTCTSRARDSVNVMSVVTLGKITTNAPPILSVTGPNGLLCSSKEIKGAKISYYLILNSKRF
jgi:hypothetical protein